MERQPIGSHSWLTAKSSQSSTPSNSTHGSEQTATPTPTASVASQRLFTHWSSSPPMRHSNTAMIVVSAAKERNRKKKKPQTRPPGIAWKTFGSATKMRPGPAVYSTP